MTLNVNKSFYFFIFLDRIVTKKLSADVTHFTLKARKASGTNSLQPSKACHIFRIWQKAAQIVLDFIKCVRSVIKGISAAELKNIHSLKAEVKIEK